MRHAPILVVPGLGGSGSEHWQTYLERSFPTATRVEQRDWDNPELSSWLERLTVAVEQAPGAVLVAHSLGCALVTHLARTRPELPIEAALFVAPADVDSALHTPGCTRCFAPMPVDLLPYRSIVVASTDDPYISIARAQALAEAWGADFIHAGAVGHINVNSGFGHWPEGEALLTELIGDSRRHRRRAAG